MRQRHAVCKREGNYLKDANRDVGMEERAEQTPKMQNRHQKCRQADHLTNEKDFTGKHTPCPISP